MLPSQVISGHPEVLTPLIHPFSFVPSPSHSFPAYANEGRVASQVWFGSKRVITVRSLEKTLKVR